MGRCYAGILGPLAMAVVIVRGLRCGGGAETICVAASLSLFAFAALGYGLGQLAQWIVDDAVRSRMERDLTHRAPEERHPK